MGVMCQFAYITISPSFSLSPYGPEPYHSIESFSCGDNEMFFYLWDPVGLPYQQSILISPLVYSRKRKSLWHTFSHVLSVCLDT